MARARSKSRETGRYSPRRIRPLADRSLSRRLRDFVPMNPDAVHHTKREHDHEGEGTAVADQRQRHAGNWQHRNSHPDVLENVSEDERGDSDDEKQTKLVACKKRDKETSQQEHRKRADEEHPADKPPLLAD